MEFEEQYSMGREDAVGAAIPAMAWPRINADWLGHFVYLRLPDAAYKGSLHQQPITNSFVEYSQKQMKMAPPILTNNIFLGLQTWALGDS